MALHGVNLGGWLIVEKWMTPSLFTGTTAGDEYTFMQTPGARAKLRNHQRTFITESDFAWMSTYGIEAVRIPVGYWVIKGDAPYVSSIGRLDWAFAMCEKYNIQIVLDVHGLPGSQNGQDHSGRVGRALWQKSRHDRDKGHAATVQLAERYANSPVLWGMQIINEPKAGIIQWKLRRYYNALYRALCTVLPAGVRIVYSDAFTPRLMNTAVWANDTHPTAMDIHWYHFLGWGHLRPRLYRHVIRHHRRLIQALRRWNTIMIGEWSGSYSQRIFDKYPQAQHNDMVGDHIYAQLAAYEAADAWFYWSYKTELPGVWNFRSLIDDGVITLSRQ